MLSFLSLALALPLSLQEPVAKPAPEPLTFETAQSPGVKLGPVWDERWSWADDDKTLLRTRGEERAWFDARTGEAAPEPAATPKTKKPGEAKSETRKALRKRLETLDGVDGKLARRLASREVAQAGDVTIHGADGMLVAVTPSSLNVISAATEIEREFAELNENGSALAFVADNDLFVIDSTTGETLARTTDGGEAQFNGKLDWVYQEEIYGRGQFQAFWWSPEGGHIAFLSLDESPVNPFTLVDHIEEGHFRVKPEITHYPKSGDPNPIVRLGVLAKDGGEPRWIELPETCGAEPLVVRVDWTPDGKLIYVVQDRLQTLADVCVWDAATQASATWIQERSNSWVNRPEPPHWLADGTFLWESHRTGYRHLYHYDATGKFVRAVTSGKWKVRSVQDIDEERGRVRFGGTRDGADERHTYTIGLNGENLVHLTPGKGVHRLSFDADESLAIDRFSSLENPGTMQLVDTKTGDVVRVLAQASDERWTERDLPRWQSLQVPTRDGLLLDGALLPPKLAEGQTKAPLWISTYSGPDAPTVRDQWNQSAWFAFLANEGIGVFQLNVRTASGMGHWAIEQVYKQMGAQELTDFEDALDWLETEYEWLDPERVGMTGYSYGGFMTAYAMTHSDRFRLGIAGGGVYDWGLYDTIYTERYMSTPQLNPDGYAKTSVLNAAKDLSGHLLIAHGVMDDNVHVQNAMQLIFALQKAGKSFELMLYPQSRHGVRDPEQRAFDRRMNWAAIQEHLLGQNFQ